MIFFPAGIIAFGLVLFLPAGSLDYWQAWLFMVTLFAPFLFAVLYFMKHDPGLLERRMRFREKVGQQKKIVSIAAAMFMMGLLVPGFDFRYGWSNVPAPVVILADVFIFLSYLLIFSVFRVNSYASRIIEVERGQRVISSGPYSRIRHPMYAGVITMYVSMTLALGSYWPLVFNVPVIALIILRTLNEEKVLMRDLKGYREYARKVRYRLIPGVW